MASNYGLELTISRIHRGPMAGAYEIHGAIWKRGSADIVAEFPAKTFLYWSKRDAIREYRAGVKSGEIRPVQKFWY